VLLLLLFNNKISVKVVGGLLFHYAPDFPFVMAYFASPGDKRKREWTQGQLNLRVYLRIVEKMSYLKAATASGMPVTTLC